ncbi:MAG: VOC family protein [Myxococcota bacterium]
MKRTLIPYLTVKNASEAITFYTQVFGMTEVLCLKMPDGRVGHAELETSEAELWLADEFPEADIVGPESRGGSTASYALYVDDVEAVAERAQEAGAKLLEEIKTEFYGDRVAKIQDPFGHRWFVHQRIEEVSREEVRRRFDEMMKS